MSAPIPLRRDFGASPLCGFAKKTKDGPQARRLWRSPQFMMARHVLRRDDWRCRASDHPRLGVSVGPTPARCARRNAGAASGRTSKSSMSK